MAEEQFTQEEVDAFASKLDGWGSALPERERRLLHALLAEAKEFADGEESEVSGFGFSITDPMSIPTLDILAASALRPVIQLKDPMQLRAFDRWDPAQ